VTAIRLSKELRETIDKWAAQQDYPPGRSEAIRRLVELGLKAHTPEPKAVERLGERVAGAAELAAKAVDILAVGAADADEKASRKRRLKAKGK
jgi:Arc/MetJ-type ribon-helix-helix transcriptional regulator